MKFQSKGEEMMWNGELRYKNEWPNWNIISHYNLSQSGCQDKIIVDFAMFYKKRLAIIIEVNGEGHYSPIFGEKEYNRIKARDEKEALWCKENGIWLLIYDWIDGYMYYNNNYWDLSDDITDTMYDIINFGWRLKD